MEWLVTKYLITAAVVVLVFLFAATMAADHHPSIVIFLAGLACLCDALWLAGYSCPATKVRASLFVIVCLLPAIVDIGSSCVVIAGPSITFNHTTPGLG